MHVTEDLGIGGLERVVSTICRNLDRDRFEPSVLCLRDGGPFADELRALGMQVDVLGAPGKADYLAFAKVRRLLRERAVDVVHTHNTQAFTDAGTAIALLGRPAPTLVHTDHARSYPDKLRYVLAERVLARLAFRVVAVSEHTRRDLVEHVGIPANKLTTIYNGIDDPTRATPAQFDALRAELRLPDDALIIGTGARLMPQKGFVHLLRAMPAVLQQIRNAYVLLVGEGPDEELLRAEADTLGIASRVRFTGARLDLPILMQLYDVFALPSVWEGLPMVVLEALARARTIVASAVGGVPDAIEHGRSGLLVPPADPAALAAALVHALGDAVLRERLGRAGREVFLDRFSARAMTARYESLYEGRAPAA